MLPVINHPTFSVNVPSNKALLKIRPMVFKEEKILLMAKQGGDVKEIRNAINTVVNNCIVSGDFSAEKAPIFDVNYIFVRIRVISVGNTVKTSYMDNEDDKRYDFEINLDDVIVKFPENVENPIKVDDTISIKLRYPRGDIHGAIDTAKEESLIGYAIDEIYNKDKTIPITNSVPKDELEKFVDSLPVMVVDNIKKFINEMPSLFYEIKYENSKGTKRVIPLSSLEDFFTFV